MAKLTAWSAGIVAHLLQANHRQFEALAPVRASHDRIHELEVELAATRADLLAVKASSSWKVTSPARWAVRQIHRVRPPRSPPRPEPPPQAEAAFDYGQWIARVEPGILRRLKSTQPGFAPVDVPGLAVVLVGSGESDTEVGRVAESTVNIIHSLPIEASEPTIIRSALALADVSFLCLVDRHCEPSPVALELVIDRLGRQPDLDVLYGDEDTRAPTGERSRPFFKPDWDAELQRGRDLAGPMVVIRAGLLRDTEVQPGPAWLYDLVNKAATATRPERIGHIPAVLAHRLRWPDGYADAIAAAASMTLRRQGLAASVKPIAGHMGWQRVVYDLPTPIPLVSIIVPTRDHADLLEVCVKGVLEMTAYARLELLVVDNGTVQPEALSILDRIGRDARVTVLRDDGPFNWSALNNAAVRHAKGDVLVLLNNDIVVLEPDWLTELVSRAIQPGIGAVGAKLLYPDGRVQHAGVTTDTTRYPRHLLRHASDDGPGPFDLLALARQVWAVTGACLVVRRSVFDAVGGLNEALPVACNDVDFCLRLTAHGYAIVWTPWAVLGHPELGTRPPDTDPARQAHAAEEMTRFWRDWGALVGHDPWLNANLELVGEQPALRSSNP